MNSLETTLHRLREAKPQLTTGQTGWKSPSNIALVKYWGKYPGQLPANPSLSLTLQTSVTETVLVYGPKKGQTAAVQFTFGETENKAFSNRIEKYLAVLTADLPFLSQLDISISSSNTFPHSSGIASSASAMSALALCLVNMADRMLPGFLDPAEMTKLASYLARLGSGSACRSVYGGFTVWGKNDYLPKATDLYAIPLDASKVSAVFGDLCDDILIVEKNAKKVSSSAGHGLMKGHPFAEDRFAVARKRLGRLLRILKKGEENDFCDLVEEEAMMLHALMMTSSPSFILFLPETIAIINKIRQFRKETKIPVCFTLDAGANVHVIYPARVKAEAGRFVRDNLLVYCENEEYLCDRLGNGPEMIRH